MKKIFKIIGIVLVFSFIICTIDLFIFLKTFDAMRFKPQIIAAAQNFLNRSVDFSGMTLKLSLRQGIKLSLTDIAIGEDPAFGSQNFLTAQEVNLGVSIKDLILKRQIRILGIEAKSPQVTIIRLKDGRINLQSLAAARAAKEQPGQGIQEKPQSKPAPSAAMGLAAIFINHLDINNARLEYIDHSPDSKISLVFEKLSLKVKDFSFNNSFPITFGSAFSGGAQDIFAKGRILGEFKIKLPGLDPDTFLSKLSGNGAFEITEGRLIDMNIFNMVLDKLSFVPDLSGAIEANLPDRFKEKVRSNDTVISSFKTNVAISDAVLILQPISLDAETFLFQGNGRIGFDQSYAFDGSFAVPGDLSGAIVKAVPEMEFLQDKEKQIRFPLKVSGKGSAVSFRPDVKQIGINAIKQKGRQELEKVLDKIFDRDAEPAKDTPSEGTQEKNKNQELIEGLIDTIFKK